MLRGRDGVHTWTSPDDLTLRLNELDSISTGAAVWPRFRLVDVSHGYPEGGDTYHNRVGRSGAVAHPDYRGSRVHSYTIEVMGRTIDELRQGEATLRAAFADQSAEGRMDVGMHPLNPLYDAAEKRYFNAKALALEPGTDAPETDLSPQLGYRREWVLGLRNFEGTYSDFNLQSETDVAGTATVDALGTASAHVILTITGPAAFPLVENTRTGERIAYHAPLGAGDVLVIDTAAQTAILNGGADVSDLLSEVDPETVTTAVASPDSGASVAGAGQNWTSPGNVIASDDSRAVAGAPSGALDYTDYLRVTDFDFAIPTDATILGLVMTVEASTSNASYVAMLPAAYLVNGGSHLGSGKNPSGAALPATDTVFTMGSAGDTWGAALTPAIVNSTTFGLDLYGIYGSTAGGQQIRVDHVTAQVTYRTASYPAPEWFSVLPGENEITITDGDLEVEWRDRWW